MSVLLLLKRIADAGNDSRAAMFAVFAVRPDRTAPGSEPELVSAENLYTPGVRFTCNPPWEVLPGSADSAARSEAAIAARPTTLSAHDRKVFIEGKRRRSPTTFGSSFQRSLPQRRAVSAGPLPNQKGSS